MENKPTINVKAFITDDNNGLTKADLIDKYEISDASVKEIAKTLGVSIRRYVAPKYVLDYTGVTAVEETPAITLSQSYDDEPVLSNSL